MKKIARIQNVHEITAALFLELDSNTASQSLVVVGDVRVFNSQQF